MNDDSLLFYVDIITYPYPNLHAGLSNSVIKDTPVAPFTNLVWL